MDITEPKEIVDQALDYIDKNLQEQLSVKKIALASGYSEYHFARIFKSYMNVSVMEYVAKRRLIKATEKILEGYKIIDVALEYGWGSHTGFTKAFKKEFGFCPAFLRVMAMEIKNLEGNSMSYIFLKRTDEHATKEELFGILKECMKENGILYDTEMLTDLYTYACSAYRGVKRHSGDEYITHTLNVAIILAELNAEFSVICGGIFCDVLEKGNVTLENIRQQIPDEIADIVGRIEQFHGKSANDEAVIMIKLAERLHNMRTVQFMDRNMQKVKAKETLDWFMPLARKLGNQKLIDELNDLSLKYL